MKKIILIALLCLPGVAIADHHRSHAVNMLFEAETNLLEVQTHMDGFGDGYTLAPWYQEYLTGYNQNIVNLIARVQALRAEVPTADLEYLRREFNQPQYYGGDPSLIRQMRGLQTSLANLTPAIVEKDALGKIRMAGKRAATAWLFISMADWHIQDAVREEIYLDPIFICSGSGNHC